MTTETPSPAPATPASAASAPRVTSDLNGHQRSKTLAAWIAFVFGALGLHRLYLHGLGDRWAWLHPLPTVLGLVGLDRHLTFGQDDRIAWALLPLLGVMLSLGMLTAIVYALTPDERWDARHHGGRPLTRTGWGAVLAAILGLLIGGGLMMATIAYSGQRFFEWQLEAALLQGLPASASASGSGSMA